MKYKRIDFITLFDVEFRHDRVSRADFQKLKDETENPALGELYSETRNWIFDREPIPSLQRFCFLPSQRLRNSNGSSIIITPEHGAGVFSVWQTITDGTDPLEVKQRAWDAGEPYQELLRLGLGIEENDRPRLSARLFTTLIGMAQNKSSSGHSSWIRGMPLAI